MADDVDRSGGVLVDGFGNLLTAPYVSVPPGWGERWHAARAAAGSRQVIVQAWGDSITAGVGAANPITQGYLAVLGDALKARYGDGGTGFLPWGANSSVTGTWTVGIGFGGGAGTATAAASLSFANLMGNTARIYHKNTNISGTLRWRINGGSFTNVTPPTDFGVEPGYVEITGLGDGPHTIDIEWVSGTVTVHGVACLKTTGIVMQRCAQSGRCGGDYSRAGIENITIGTTNTSTTITSATPGAFTSSMVGKFVKATGVPQGTTLASAASATSATLSAAATATATVSAELCRNNPAQQDVPGGTVEAPFGLAPALGRADLLVVALGANDPASSYRPADLAEGINYVLRPHTKSSSVATSPDVVVLIEHFGNWFDQSSVYPSLTAEVAKMAAGHGAAVIDVWGSGRRSFKFWNDAGMLDDAIHPSTLGHARGYAAPLIDLLTR